MDIQSNRFTYNLADLMPADINLSVESYVEALNRELSRAIRARLDLNLYHLMDEVLDRTRIRMTKPEIDTFINRKVKNNLKLEVSDDGNVMIEYRLRK